MERKIGSNDYSNDFKIKVVNDVLNTSKTYKEFSKEFHVRFKSIR